MCRLVDADAVPWQDLLVPAAHIFHALLAGPPKAHAECSLNLDFHGSIVLKNNINDCCLGCVPPTLTAGRCDFLRLRDFHNISPRHGIELVTCELRRGQLVLQNRVAHSRFGPVS